MLFNGKDLDGWKLTDPRADSGWSVKDGVLAIEWPDRLSHSLPGALTVTLETVGESARHIDVCR